MEVHIGLAVASVRAAIHEGKGSRKGSGMPGISVSIRADEGCRGMRFSLAEVDLSKT